eukprot:TRINITY_DN44065_c0_g1_i1.p1 TRINITY_DN44065_c0_g1~~TRINITY_DN44065_c0_g1_i1.p1  ORF type:complete len:911 (+),score=117.84 TRINITY_DN44065_c0_g1_i1:83-2815(+)
MLVRGALAAAVLATALAMRAPGSDRHSDADELRHGRDRWLSGWVWGKDGESVMFRFSATDHAVGNDHWSPIPILLLRCVHDGGAAVGETVRRSYYRGWIEGYTDTGAKGVSMPDWSYVEVTDLPRQSEPDLVCWYRFGLELGGSSGSVAADNRVHDATAPSSPLLPLPPPQVLWLSGERRFWPRRLGFRDAVRFVALGDYWLERGGTETFQAIEGRFVAVKEAAAAAVTGSVPDEGQGWTHRDGEAPMVALLDLGDSGYVGHCRSFHRVWATKGYFKSTLPCSHWRGGFADNIKMHFQEASRVSGLLPSLMVAGNHELDMEEAFLSRARVMPFAASRSPTPYYWSTRLGPVYLIGIFSELGRDGVGFPQFDDEKHGSNVTEIAAYLMDTTGTSEVNALLQAQFMVEQISRGLGMKMNQLVWLEKELFTSWRLKRTGEVTWTVVMSHRNGKIGGYCSRNHWECLTSKDFQDKRNMLTLHNILERLFFKYEVDMHLSGHTHQYERTKPVYAFQQVQPGGSVGQNTKEKDEESLAAADPPSYPPSLPNETRPALMAPIYVTAPAGAWGWFVGPAREEDPNDIAPPLADVADELNRMDPADWQIPQPAHVAKRLSARAWGHLELLASTEKLRLEFHGRLLRDDPRVEVLDAVEYHAADASSGVSNSGSPGDVGFASVGVSHQDKAAQNADKRAAALERRAAAVAQMIGGRHELPSTEREHARCVEAVRREAPPSLVLSPPGGRGPFARACLEGNLRGVLWRTLIDVNSILTELTLGPGEPEDDSQHATVKSIIQRKRFDLVLSFEAALNAAMHARTFPNYPSQDEFMVQFVEFAFCPPAACDKVDLAGAVALPALLNRSQQLGRPVGFPFRWFAKIDQHSRRCADLDCALRSGVFEDGAGEIVPRMDLVPPEIG